MLGKFSKTLIEFDSLFVLCLDNKHRVILLESLTKLVSKRCVCEMAQNGLYLKKTNTQKLLK